MLNKRELAKARLLVLCSQIATPDSHVRFIAHKLDLSETYVRQLVFGLESDEKLTLTRTGQRKVISGLSSSAVDTAKDVLRDHVLD